MEITNVRKLMTIKNEKVLDNGDVISLRGDMNVKEDGSIDSFSGSFHCEKDSNFDTRGYFSYSEHDDTINKSVSGIKAENQLMFGTLLDETIKEFKTPNS